MSKELKLNIILLLLSIIIYLYVIPVYTADIMHKSDFGPQMFPKIAIAVIGVASLGLILQELLAHRNGKSSKVTATKNGGGIFTVFVIVFLYIFSVTFIGFYSSSFTLTAIYFRKMPRRSYFIIMLLLLLLFCMIWFLFEKMMKVPLPAGLLI